MQDWKDQLSAAFGIEPDQNAAEPETESPATAQDPVAQQGKQPLNIIFERKGRAGKQVTLIVDFLLDDDALADVARQIKQHLGVGGSARGGEILIQGDHRQRVKQLLTQMGFKVKGG